MSKIYIRCCELHAIMKKTEKKCPSSMSHLVSILNYLESDLEHLIEEERLGNMEKNQSWPLRGQCQDKIKKQITLINEKKEEYEAKTLDEILEEESEKYGFKRVVFTNEKLETGTATCKHCGKIFKDTKTGKAQYFLNRHNKTCFVFTPKHLIKDINNELKTLNLEQLQKLLQQCKDFNK